MNHTEAIRPTRMMKEENWRARATSEKAELLWPENWWFTTPRTNRSPKNDTWTKQ